MKRLLFPLAWMVPALGLMAGTGEDWPQWRGPHFDGSARANGLPSELSSSNTLWTAELPGKSGATPIISGDTVFVSTADAQRQLSLLALDRGTGKTRWTATVAVGDKDVGRNNMASPSPVTDGKRVFAMFGTGDLAAFDFAGKELWHRNLGKDYGKFAVMWIYGSSPTLFEGRLYVQVLQRPEVPPDYPQIDGNPKRESYLLQLDPATGETLWKHVRYTDSTKESNEAYSTPIPYRGVTGTQLLVVGGDHVSGHRLADGGEIWRARLYEKRDDWYRIVTSPVAFEGLIYASGPKGQPVVAYREGAKGEVGEAQVAWRFQENPTDWSTPLVLDGKLFVLDGGKRVLSRLNPKTGAVAWSGKLAGSGPIWGSPTGADGKLYLVSEDGTVSVVSAGEEFTILSSTRIADAGPIRGSVAVANGQVFIRTAKQLHCYGSH